MWGGGGGSASRYAACGSASTSSTRPSCGTSRCRSTWTTPPSPGFGRRSLARRARMPKKRRWGFGDRGGGATRFPPGKYLLQVQQIIDENDDGTPLLSKSGKEQIRVKFKVVGVPPGAEEYEGLSFSDWFTQVPQSLWTWRIFLEAAMGGREIPGHLAGDLDTLENQHSVVAAMLYTDNYGGTSRTKVDPRSYAPAAVRGEWIADEPEDPAAQAIAGAEETEGAFGVDEDAFGIEDTRVPESI